VPQEARGRKICKYAAHSSVFSLTGLHRPIIEQANKLLKPSEVAGKVAKVLGHDEFSEYVIVQGLNSRAFSRLDNHDLLGFLSSKSEKGPLVGDLMDLMHCVDELKQLMHGTSEPAVSMPRSETKEGKARPAAIRSVTQQQSKSASTVPAAVTNKKSASQSAQGRQGDVSMSEQLDGLTSFKEASASRNSSKGRQRKSKGDNPCIGKSSEDFQDAEIFATPY
jgi:hypothetical protein